MKRFAALFAIICLMAVPALTQMKAPKSLFFVIDVSGSMETNQIFKPLKNEIIKYIKTEADKGDFVSIITFGTDVKLIAGEKISDDNTATNIALLVDRVDQLAAKEKYTHMTRALDLLASQMGLIKAANPEGMVKAFLFTDGKNEPPPNAEGSQWTFDEILRKHYNVFDNPSTYLFIITLGIQPDEELVQAVQEKKDKIFINSVPDASKLEERNIIPKELPAPPVIPSVMLELTGPKTIKAGESARYELKVQFKNARDGAEGKKISLKPELSPGCDYSSEKEEIAVSGEEEEFPIILKNPAPGSYLMKIAVWPAEEMKVDPVSFELDFVVKKPNYTWLFALLALIFFGGGIFLLIKSIPRFGDEHRVVDVNTSIPYILKEKQKLFASSVSSKDLGIMEADFSIKIDKKTGDVTAKVLKEGKWKVVALNNGDMIVDPYKFEIATE